MNNPSMRNRVLHKSLVAELLKEKDRSSQFHFKINPGPSLSLDLKSIRGRRASDDSHPSLAHSLITNFLHSLQVYNIFLLSLTFKSVYSASLAFPSSKPILTANKFGSVHVGLKPLHSILAHQSMKLGKSMPCQSKRWNSTSIWPSGKSWAGRGGWGEVTALREEMALNSLYSMSIFRISLGFVSAVEWR